MFDVFTLSEDATHTLSLSGRPAPRFRARSKAPPARRHPAAGRDEVKRLKSPSLSRSRVADAKPSTPGRILKAYVRLFLAKKGAEKTGGVLRFAFPPAACAPWPALLGRPTYITVHGVGTPTKGARGGLCAVWWCSEPSDARSDAHDRPAKVGVGGSGDAMAG